MAHTVRENTELMISEHNNRAGLAIRLMLEAIHRESNPKTPMLTGQLRADIKKEVLGTRGKIRWGKHYAWYQERGYTSGPVKRYTTPGTGAHFAEDAVMSVTKNSKIYFKQAGLI